MKISTIKKGLIGFGLTCFSLTLFLTTGCTQSYVKHSWNARAPYMIPADFDVANKYPYTVALCESAEGSVPGSAITALIWDDDIINALRHSLIKSELFKEVTESNVADYVLCVTIMKYDQPIFASDVEIKLKTKWDLKQAKTGQFVWSDVVDSAFKVKLGEMPLAAVRAQMATEGSIRVNIREGIRRLSIAKF